MGFDKHFYEDHCYLDDTTNDVGMNVEIIEDSYQTVDVAVEKPRTRYPSGVYDKQHNASQETIKSETPRKATTHVYLPYTEICTEHPDMLLLEDEKLLKPGDKFATHYDFVQYLNENAKRWYFYYKCSDSRKPNTENEVYTYTCVYLKNKEKYKKKGFRKRNNNMKTDCPCKIKLRHLPNEKELTVVYVCNHHDHELSLEQFCKLQHGRRLPPYVKQETIDLLTLKVDKAKIKKYVEMETGFKMSHQFFYTLEKNLLKSKYGERHISEERLKLLNQKIAAVEEMYGHIEGDNSAQTKDCEEKSSLNLKAKIKPDFQVKRKLKTSKDVTVADSPDKQELSPEANYSETIQSVQELQESIKCEIEKNPWVPDQCVPVLSNRTTITDNANETYTDTQYDLEKVNTDAEIPDYSIDCYNSRVTQQIINNDFNATVNDSHDSDVGNENDIDNIAYETVVIDGNSETHNEIYVSDSLICNDDIAIHNDVQENINDIIMSNHGFDNIQDIIEVDHVEYLDEGDGNIVAYVTESDDGNINNSNENVGHDVGIQTNRYMDTGQTILPVFDVYMKDGNVTGFVINDNLMNGLKDGVDKGIQTSEDIIYSDIEAIENEDAEIIEDSTDQTGDTYTKHEYIHKYNIEQYMTQSNFPKYVDILAKETHTDVLNMFTNVYNEKAMFKLTTTQKGKEGNTRIRYITHNGKIQKRKTGDSLKREKLGKKLHSVFVLKEKLRLMKKQNDQLLKRNKYLEGVTLNLV